VPELVPDEALVKSGAKAARAAFAHVPVIKPDQLVDADAIIFGTPRDSGTCASQSGISGPDWSAVGERPAGRPKSQRLASTGTASTADRKTTITSFHTTLLPPRR